MPQPPPDTTTVAALIHAAFATIPYPGDGNLVRSRGDEPDEVATIFRGQSDWRALPADLLDRAGAASPSALSFFSGPAFRFFLPAFLLADLQGHLRLTDPVFYLYHGLTVSSRTVPVHLPDGTVTTWWDVQQAHLGHLSAAEASAILAYLRHKLAGGTLTAPEELHVRQAIASYWEERARGRSR